MWPPNSSDSDKIYSYFSATPFSKLLQFQEYLEHSWFYNRDDWVCKDCIFTFSWHFPALKQWVTLIDIKQWVSLIKKNPFASLFSSLLAVLQIQVSPLFFFSNPSPWHVSYVAGPQCEITVKSMRDRCHIFYLLFKSWLYHADMFPVAGPQCEITASIPCLETPASSFVYS